MRDFSAERLAEWIVAREAAGLVLSRVAPFRSAQQFVSMVIADAQLAALTGIGMLGDAQRRAC